MTINRALQEGKLRQAWRYGYLQHAPGPLCLLPATLRESWGARQASRGTVGSVCHASPLSSGCQYWCMDAHSPAFHSRALPGNGIFFGRLYSRLSPASSPPFPVGVLWGMPGFLGVLCLWVLAFRGTCVSLHTCACPAILRSCASWPLTFLVSHPVLALAFPGPSMPGFLVCFVPLLSGPTGHSRHTILFERILHPIFQRQLPTHLPHQCQRNVVSNLHGPFCFLPAMQICRCFLNHLSQQP